MPPRKGLSRLLTQLRKSDWLTAMIDEACNRDGAEHWDSHPNPVVHPSNSGSVCARDIELSMLGHKTAIAGLNRRRMDNGTAAHERWNKILESAGVLVGANIRYVEEGKWSGEIDVCVQNPATGAHHIVEIKTMNDMRWQAVPSQTEDLLTMAKILMQRERNYVCQLIHYLVKFAPGDPLLSDVGGFLFENTNTQDYKVLWLRPDEEMRVEAFVNTDAAHNAAMEGVLLDPPFERKSDTCRRCYRKAACFSLQDGDIETTMHAQRALEMMRQGEFVTSSRQLVGK